MKTKKIFMLAFIACLLLVGGCGASNKTEKNTKSTPPSDKETLLEAIDKFEALQSIHVESRQSGSTITNNSGDTLITPIDKNSQYTLHIQNNKIYTVNNFVDSVSTPSIFLSRTDGKHSLQIQTEYKQDDVENGYVKKGVVMNASIGQSNEKIQLNQLDSYKKYIDGEYQDCFTVASKKDGEYTIFSLILKDYIKYDELEKESLKKSYPDYNPLIFNGVEVEKRETTMYQFDFKVNKDGYIVAMNYDLVIDFGNELKQEYHCEFDYSNFNKAKINTKMIDDLYDKVKDGKLDKGDSIEFKNIPVNNLV